MFFWRRMLVEAFGAASPHPLLGFPWRSCKTSTMVLCTTKCGQEKGEGKDLSSRWCHCSPSRSFITVSSALSFHPCPWHAQDMPSFWVSLCLSMAQKGLPSQVSGYQLYHGRDPLTFPCWEPASLHPMLSGMSSIASCSLPPFWAVVTACSH